MIVIVNILQENTYRTTSPSGSCRFAHSTNQNILCLSTAAIRMLRSTHSRRCESPQMIMWKSPRSVRKSLHPALKSAQIAEAFRMAAGISPRVAKACTQAADTSPRVTETSSGGAGEVTRLAETPPEVRGKLRDSRKLPRRRGGSCATRGNSPGGAGEVARVAGNFPSTVETSNIAVRRRNNHSFIY
jgi:hypothetical protein